MTKRYVVSAAVEELGDQPGYLAVCSDVPGCHAEGATIAEALDNLQDVVRMTLEFRIEKGLGIPEGLEASPGSAEIVAQIVVPVGEVCGADSAAPSTRAGVRASGTGKS